MKRWKVLLWVLNNGGEVLVPGENKVQSVLTYNSFMIVNNMTSMVTEYRLTDFNRIVDLLPSNLLLLKDVQVHG